jgi:hypothetical protein
LKATYTAKPSATREPTALPLTSSAPHRFAPTRTSQGASNRKKEERPSLTGRRVRDPIRLQKHMPGVIALKGRFCGNGTGCYIRRGLSWGRDMAMAQPRSGKALINESHFPYIVELAVPDTGLEIELNRQIVGFHKSRSLQPRHGRRIIRDNQTYSRWCFSDWTTARAFVEQFGGAFYK